jgi:hypothetical protein
MNADEFVDAVKHRALYGAVDSTMTNLSQPPGTRPHPRLVKVSEWFNRLSEADREMVERVAWIAADHAVGTLLTVVDNMAWIEASSEGRLELWHVHGEERTLLNDPKQEPLNDKLHD